MSEIIFDGEIHYDEKENKGYLALAHDHEIMMINESIGPMEAYCIEKMRVWLKENGRMIDNHNFVYRPEMKDEFLIQNRYFILSFTLEQMFRKMIHVSECNFDEAIFLATRALIQCMHDTNKINNCYTSNLTIKTIPPSRFGAIDIEIVWSTKEKITRGNAPYENP